MYLVENESPRGAVAGHTFEPKEPQRRKEKQTQILENMQRGSLKRRDSRMLVFVVWLRGDEHTHMVFRY